MKIDREDEVMLSLQKRIEEVAAQNREKILKIGRVEAEDIRKVQERKKERKMLIGYVSRL